MVVQYQLRISSAELAVTLMSPVKVIIVVYEMDSLWPRREPCRQVVYYRPLYKHRQLHYYRILTCVDIFLIFDNLTRVDMLKRISSFCLL
jgi:hypothetical protein